MAEEPGTSTGTVKGEGVEEEGEGEEGTSHTKDWLQLSLGSSHNITRQRQCVTNEIVPGGAQAVLRRTPVPWTVTMWNTGPFIRRGDGQVNLVCRDEMRVVIPPRPQSGVWFFFQASKNQGREPYLPQIPKSYLRLKDGRGTVRLLMKYLVNKLGLVDESEIEIRCRGHVLLPLSTIQQVRDNVWCLREATGIRFADNNSSLIDHIMTLQYSRKA